jgi:hypothetical protein
MMADLTSQQLENFFKKAERFFISNYPILEDENGMPTKVLTEKTSYSLIHAVDRMYLTQNITEDLIKIMCFDPEEASELASYYANLKYEEYCNYIMNL